MTMEWEFGLWEAVAGSEMRESSWFRDNSRMGITMSYHRWNGTFGCQEAGLEIAMALSRDLPNSGQHRQFRCPERFVSSLEFLNIFVLQVLDDFFRHPPRKGSCQSDVSDTMPNQTDRHERVGTCPPLRNGRTSHSFRFEKFLDMTLTRKQTISQ